MLNDRLFLDFGRALCREARLLGRLVLAFEGEAKGGRQDADVIGRCEIRLVSGDVVVFALRRIF